MDANRHPVPLPPNAIRLGFLSPEHSRHAAAHFGHHLGHLAHLFHHRLHLVKFVHHRVYFGYGYTAAGSDTTTTAGIENRWIPAFFWCHGANHPLHPLG
jgi:hypothetical protein